MSDDSAAAGTEVPGRLRALRIVLGVSQEQLARQLGVSFATVNRWEGGRTVPGARALERISELEQAAASGDLAEPDGEARGGEPVRTSGQPDRAALPATWPGSSFVGRKAELRRLAQLLETSRLVTVVGPAGCGKTRLAFELLTRNELGVPVVGVVALAPVLHTDLVAGTVSATLGLRDAKLSHEEQLVEELAGAAGLLVLDNCEHMRDAVATLAGYLLARCPQLRILTTSRELLGLDGETVWHLPPLGLPEPGQAPDAASRSDALALFLARARERSPDHLESPRSVADAATVCRMLDGLPLAIELAAAWVGTLTPGEIAARLDDRFAVLVQSGRNEPRHRTMRAAIEWSGSLLEPADRYLLARLSVLRGLWTLADAEAVTEFGHDDLLLRVRRLVESSWVVALAGSDPDHPTRYRMLETLRAYAFELLAKSGDLDDTTERYGAYLADRAARLAPGLFGPTQSVTVEQLDLLGDDFEAALSWADSRGETDLGLHFVAALWNWWLIKGRVAEGRRWAEAFLAKTSSAAEPPALARAHHAAAVFGAEQGDYDSAQTHGRAARQQFIELGDRAGSGDACRVLAIVARFRGELDEAEVLLEEALESYRHAGEEGSAAAALNNLAALVIDSGDLARGRRLLTESIAAKRRLGDRRSLAASLVNLADIVVRDGAAHEALPLLDEARTIASELSDTRLLAFVEHNLGDAELAGGRTGAAIGHYEQALRLFEQAGAARDVTLALCSLGKAQHTNGAKAAAIRSLRRSEQLAGELGDAQRVAEARAALAACGETPARATLPGGITGREADVLGLLAAGLSNREIAAQLVLSVATVERHVANIYAKLDVRSRVEATRYAVRHGLATPPR
jgi:non-specific serine/threonine protein kinase